MKKMNTLLSFLIAFSFVTVAFGQEDDALTRTTPVISHSGNTGNGGSQHIPSVKWGTVNVKNNTVTLKLTKSVACAVLQSISAWSIAPGKTDEVLNISYNPNDLKNLQVGVQKSIVIKLLDNFSEKKVNIKLDWDLKGCNENALGMAEKPKQTQVKSMAAPIAPSQPANPNKPSNPSGGSYNSSDSFFVILKTDVGVKSGTTTNAVEKRKDQVSTIRSTEND
jgi:hypothetical protein